MEHLWFEFEVKKIKQKRLRGLKNIKKQRSTIAEAWFRYFLDYQIEHRGDHNKISNVENLSKGSLKKNFIGKVQLFWEGGKNLKKNSPNFIDVIL